MRALIVLLFCILASAAGAQTPTAPPGDVKLRVYFEPDSEIHVGQLVRLWTEISTSTWFTKAPTYPELKLEGAISLLPEQLGVNFTEQKDGKTVTGQRQRYVIIPQRPGTFEIPSLSIPVGVAVDGKPSQVQTLKTEPISLTATVPAGAEAIANLVVIDELKVTENYDGKTEGLKAGDGVTRQITLEAAGTFGLALPPPDFGKPDGVRLYLAQPVLEDKVNRGQYNARRTDAVTYVFEREGEFVLPEITIQWWNPETKAAEEKVLEPLTVQVAANKALNTGGSGKPDSEQKLTTDLKRWIVVALNWLRENMGLVSVGAIGLYLVWLAAQRLVPLARRQWSDYRTRYLQSERFAFGKFQKACRSGDEGAIVNEFWRWMEHFSSSDQLLTVGQLTQGMNEPAFQSLMGKLAKRRYLEGQADLGDSSELLRTVTNLRLQLLDIDVSETPGRAPTLNPRFNKQAAKA